MEFAKAHMYKKEFTQSLDCLSRVDKSKWESTFFYISGINHNGLEDVEKAKEDLNKSIELDNKNIDAYVFLASLIYTSDIELATEYLDIALYLDSEYPKAYYVRAQISQLSDDFSAVIENCEKYISYSGDFENESVLLMLATNKFHLKVNGWQMQFLKWDRVFRKNHNIVGENKMSILDWGRKYMCPFFIHSNENEVTVFLGEKELFSAGIGMSRTAIGLYSPEIDKKLLEFSLKEENNPIRKSSKAIFDEVALPMIAKIYNDYKSYQQVVESLLKEEVLYLNHDFSEHIKEYVIEKDDVEVNIQVIGNKLIGDARIGNFWMRLEIDPLTINIDRFVEQLNKDCGHNEAAIILTNLNIDGFSKMMKSPSYCYKFYWLEAIIQLISEGKTESTFDEIIDEMITNAWYSVREFHIHLSGMPLDGQIKDGLERAVLLLTELSELSANASKVEIKNAINQYNKELKTTKEQLTHMVPYRALAGFFTRSNEKVNWNSANRMTAYIQKFNKEVLTLPYILGTSSKLKKEVYFQQDWIKMIQDHTVNILGWIQYEKVKCCRTIIQKYLVWYIN